MVDAEAKKIDLWSSTGQRMDPEDVGLDRIVGWDISYVQVGGNKPQRDVFNQLIYELSSLSLTVLSTGIMPWDASVSYVHHAFCVGSDGRIYITKEDTGPRFGNSSDPTLKVLWEEY